MADSPEGLPTKLQLVAAALIGITASAAFLLVGLATEGWQPDPSGHYPYTEGLGQLWGWPGALTASAVLLSLARLLLLVIPVSAAALIVPYLVALGFELAQSSSGHNLFPFEVAIVFLGSGVLHIPACLLRIAVEAQTRRRER